MNDQIYRQLQILQWVPRYPGRITIGQIEDKMLDHGVAVSQRTLQRDIETLSQLFIGLSNVRYRDHSVGWYWSVDAPFLNLTGMTIHQALAFNLINKFLGPLFPPTTLNELHPFFEQAEATLHSLNNNPLRAWPKKIAVVHPLHPRQLPPIDPAVQKVVIDALLTEHQLHIVYGPSFGKTKSYRLNPLGILLRGTITYLIATKDTTDEIRLFTLHQIREATIDASPITGNAEYDLDELVDDSQMGFDWSQGGSYRRTRLKMLIDWKLAKEITHKPLVHDQSIVDYDASRKLFTASIQETGQLFWWLIEHGERAEVLEPLSLRNKVIKKIRGLATRYAVNNA